MKELFKLLDLMAERAGQYDAGTGIPNDHRMTDAMNEFRKHII